MKIVEVDFLRSVFEAVKVNDGMSIPELSEAAGIKLTSISKILIEYGEFFEMEERNTSTFSGYWITKIK